MSGARAVVFDLDGTLIDSAPDLHAAANRMLAELDRPALTLAQVTSFVGNGVPKLVERCLGATGGVTGGVAGGVAGFDAALGRFHALYAEAPADLTRPYPGVAEALAALRDAGCALGICTNKPEAPARRILELLGMDGLFGAVIGGDTAPVRKPDPAPLRLALQALGAETALFVGDSETDEATAQNAALPFGFFTGGYRKKPAEAFEATFAFADFADLPGHVLQRAA